MSSGRQTRMAASSAIRAEKTGDAVFGHYVATMAGASPICMPPV